MPNLTLLDGSKNGSWDFYDLTLCHLGMTSDIFPKIQLIQKLLKVLQMIVRTVNHYLLCKDDVEYRAKNETMLSLCVL